MSLFISEAVAQAGGQAPAGAGLDFFIMIGVFFLIMYFMIIRPQSKRAKEHKQMLEALKKGDEVVTNGGLAGKVKDIGESFVDLEVADGVVVKVQKAAIGSVLPKGSLKAKG